MTCEGIAPQGRGDQKKTQHRPQPDRIIASTELLSRKDTKVGNPTTKKKEHTKFPLPSTEIIGGLGRSRQNEVVVNQKTNSGMSPNTTKKNTGKNKLSMSPNQEHKLLHTRNFYKERNRRKNNSSRHMNPLRTKKRPKRRGKQKAT